VRLALVLLLVARTATAQPNDAERLYTDGQKAYDDKRYDDALAAWEKAYELSHLPGLVFNLAGSAASARKPSSNIESSSSSIRRRHNVRPPRD